MPNTQTAQNPKHLKGFWPIFTIIVAALVAGGIVLFYVSGNELQDNINSLNFFHKSETPKTPVKKSDDASAATAK